VKSAGVEETVTGTLRLAPRAGPRFLDPDIMQVIPGMPIRRFRAVLCGRSEREIRHPISPVVFVAALDGEQEFLNRQTDRHPIVHDEDA
jgi:hypothetical protein